MQLDILFDAPTLDEMKNRINEHFNQIMRVHRELLSLFEQYQVRPTEKFIPEAWKYRIVCKKGKYFFGTLRGSETVK